LEDDGNQARSFQPVYSAPSAGNGVVVFGTGDVFGALKVGLIIAMSRDEGNVLWSYDPQSAVRSSPAIAGNMVLVGGAAGDLFAFSPA
jgi:outer membrane protein assembly factor BamB